MASPLVSDLLQFIDSAPTPYHATAAVARRLQACGFRELEEGNEWLLSASDRVFVRRADASIAAFIIGTSSPCDSGFNLVGAHTDSPNMRLKPRAELNQAGYKQCGVESYGGVLLSTWLDRDLSLAGRVFVRSTSGPQAKLVDLQRPLFRIPNLAIHLNRTVNREGLKLNIQQHMVPVLGMAADTGPSLAERLAIAIDPEAESADILSGDLCLYDTQPSSLGGENDSFIFAPRMDNLASCHSGVTALLDAIEPSVTTRGVVLYDHEEVGSRSTHGADSTFLETCLRRISDAVGDPGNQGFDRAISRSMLLSCDMAHAVHPNYADMHDQQHGPLLGRGPVIKRHAGQSYATDAESEAFFLELCQAVAVTPQHFVTRSDLGCGSTIGPLSAARLGIRTIDIGNPLLSMHSIREMGASADVDTMYLVLRELFRR